MGFSLRLIPAQLEYCIALGSYLSKIAHSKNKAPNRWADGAGRPMFWLSNIEQISSERRRSIFAQTGQRALTATPCQAVCGVASQPLSFFSVASARGRYRNSE
jgi:hypothetical protein